MKINNNSFAVIAQVLSTLIEVLTMGNLVNVILVKESKKEKRN
jgi:ACR3 family arsenite efflux pump ArsB